MKKSTWILGGAGLAGVAAFGVAAARRRGRGAKEKEEEEIHAPSMTAIAADAMRRGTLGTPPRREDETDDDELRVGDPDVDAMENAFVGDAVPGGDMPTPDQDRVDDIGRAYGVAEEDSGELRTSAELLEARDRRRSS
jgi:hypothetical protein